MSAASRFNTDPNPTKRPEPSGRPRRASDPTYPWPAIRETQEGVVRVTGRYRDPGRSVILKALTRIGMTLLGLAMMLAATAPSWYDRVRYWVEGSWTEPGFDALWELRSAERWLLGDTFPELGARLRYVPASAIDLPMLVPGLMIFCLAKKTAGPVARLVTLLGWPLLSKRLRVTIERDWVIVHRLLRRDVSVRRQAGDTNVTFRAVPLKEHRPQLAEWLRMHGGLGLLSVEPSHIEVVNGLRCHRIALLEDRQRAEQFVAALQHTLAQSRALSPRA